MKRLKCKSLGRAKGGLSVLPNFAASDASQNFKGGSDGSYPVAGVTFLNGALYGTTQYGGENRCSDGNGNAISCGTIFALTTAGQETILHRFDSESPTDGYGPLGSLVALNGTLYGTTAHGGNVPCGSYQIVIGCGTVFKTTTAVGSERVIYNFQAGGDGFYPFSGLTVVGDELYGTTATGPSDFAPAACTNSDPHVPNGCGTVFEVSPSGNEEDVFAFSGGTTDGALPASPLLIGPLIVESGVLYGTTGDGGTSGNGTVSVVSGLISLLIKGFRLPIKFPNSKLGCSYRQI